MEENEDPRPDLDGSIPLYDQKDWLHSLDSNKSFRRASFFAEQAAAQNVSLMKGEEFQAIGIVLSDTSRVTSLMAKSSGFAELVAMFARAGMAHGTDSLVGRVEFGESLTEWKDYDEAFEELESLSELVDEDECQCSACTAEREKATTPAS